MQKEREAKEREKKIETEVNLKEQLNTIHIIIMYVKVLFKGKLDDKYFFFYMDVKLCFFSSVKTLHILCS